MPTRELISASVYISLANSGIIWTPRECYIIRGKPYHPMTQAKIDRYHRTMKYLVKLQNYYFPEKLELEIKTFVEYYNHQRVHESLDNLTSADVYFGRAREIKVLRDLIKEQTQDRRKRENRGLAPLKNEIIKPAMLREYAS